MRGIEVLRVLFNGSFAIVDERLASATEDTWTGQALPDTNKPGFILWHCARILDWTVHSAIQGVPEVASSDPWRDRFPRDGLAGFGIPPDLADRIAASTRPRDVVAYLGDVRTRSRAWFDLQTDETLDAVPPLKANQSPAYLEPSVWAEISDLDGLPSWQLLMRPAGVHIRRHIGEYDVLVGALQARTTTRA